MYYLCGKIDFPIGAFHCFKNLLREHGDVKFKMSLKTSWPILTCIYPPFRNGLSNSMPFC